MVSLTLHNSTPDSTDDIESLLKWLSTQVLPLNIPKDIHLPEQVHRILQATENSRVFVPVFQRLLYSHANEFEKYFTGQIMDFFVWIERVSSHMGLLYHFFQLGMKERVILRRTEYSIYQGFVEIIWYDLKFYLAELEDYSELRLVANTLTKVNLVDMLDDLVYHVSKMKITNQVKQMYQQTPILDELEQWIIFHLYASLKPLVSDKNCHSLKDTLVYFSKTTLVEKRAENIFELVHLYPESISTLKEIHNCLTVEYEKSFLVEKFIEELNNRLLLPSTNTTEIILYYINTIHSFLIIDHRGVLLDKVARSIRKYLCSRNDTVERIVDGLLNTDESQNKLIELNKELNKGGIHSKELNSLLQLQKRTLNWVPDPVDALPDFQIGKIDDIIESLTSIFENDSVFVDQFVKIFSVDLLKIKNYEISEIIQKLDLLKYKFEESNFSKIDVMINDVKKSKMIDALIKLNNHQDFNIHGMFLSRLFWPNLLSDDSIFLLDPDLKDKLAKYESAFKILQKGREVKLHPKFTTVSLVVDMNGSQRNYEVTLDKYSVLRLIQEMNANVVKVGIIMMKLKMPLQMIKKSVDFWVKEGVLLECDGGWKINE
ncbi:hypothetical protein CANINC_003800 [Pichia inconspicua]|uniref:Cullin family profile domain-containing protein n=1 Tax=Pichia inconspicua TaxID=52247 RepID=A0A4T0WXU0_9ASCO|nr:hypothetical protein CANINC_003800 [[Candida] inconspicua]